MQLLHKTQFTILIIKAFYLDALSFVPLLMTQCNSDIDSWFFFRHIAFFNLYDYYNM